MSVVEKTLERLEIERLDTYLFRGLPNDWPNRHVFGGHVIAQALDAADQTVPENYKLHSMHCYFLRAGQADKPIIYEVDAIRDGRSFMTRRVTAIQDSRPIFTIASNYHIPEIGINHQIDLRAVTQPEDLEDDAKYIDRMLEKAGLERANPMWTIMPFEFRSTLRVDFLERKPADPIGGHWIRLREPIGHIGESRLGRLLAFVSDYYLISSNMRPHAMITRDPRLKTTASLDHAMWFHDNDFDLDNWIYYKTEGAWTGHGRAFARGALYHRDGRLLASTAQEGLVRLKDPENTETALGKAK